MRMMAKLYSGTFGGLKRPDICLTGEQNHEKTSPRKHVPIGDRTRARCVTGAHATTWPTAVDKRLGVNNGETCMVVIMPLLLIVGNKKRLALRN